ncbi:MAG: hypothetical protein UW04_C0020G0005 [Parcubacteria group bacterium GW2011_GWB1_43_8]|nr:MAG: hypothetical protein UW04_C0020G0005 [Parcubacteria group bacterium GW2011_GWB1_43_8]
MKSLFLNKSKKYIAWFLCLTFLFNLLSLAPNEAKAVGGVADEVTVIGAPITDAQLAILLGDVNTELALMEEDSVWHKTVEWFKTNWYQINDTITQKGMLTKEYVLDGLAWTAANVIIDKFSDSLVTWIQSGFEGSPMFLSDPEGFFKDTANDISGAIINDLNMNWLCDSLKFRFDLDFFLPGTSKSKYACTYEDIVENFSNMADRDLGDWIDVNVSVNEQNVVRRFGDDFRNGGFLMWLNTSLPRNNTTGRILTAWDEVAMASEQAKERERFGLSINGGFFGLRKCVEYGKGDSYEAFGKVTDEVNANPKDKCTKYVDTTPGQLVQDQLKNVGGKDFSRLQVADEIDEIIGALATTMMGWMLTGGNDDGGVLGYDSDADYSGSNRDHYGELSKSQQTTTKKSNISGQITNIKNNEEQYNNSLENYADALYGAKEKLEIVLAKLKCIRATSTNDTGNTYDDTDCDGADEDTKNVLLSAVDKTESDTTSDISKTEDQISSIDGKISTFNDKYGENATSTSAQALELFDEFEDEVNNAGSLGKITSIINEYCYSYNKDNKTGKICGLFGEKSSGDGMSVYISAESNPATEDSAGNIKTKIYWKAVNAESCSATGGDSDKTWKKTEISTSGSYTATNFEDGESRTYGVKCSDAENNTETAEVSVSADSSVTAEMSGSLFAKNTFVKSGESSSLYWLSSNANQCYLYSDQDSFSGDAEYVTGTSTGLYENEGYYLKTSLTKTTGQSTAIFNAGETFKYKLICGDSSEAYSVFSELEIASEDGDKETYKTHSEKEYKALNKEAGKIEGKMESIELEYSCILDDYTQSEDVSNSECSSFESSSSSSSQ